MSWHYEPTTRIFTRHPAPDIDGRFDVRGLYGLPDSHHRQMTTIHEAGHAAVLLAAGIPFDHMSLGQHPNTAAPQAGYVKCTFTGTLETYIHFFAAGERAQDRWLREQGLWTPIRAWATEILAYTDRQGIAEYAPADDLTALHDEVDTLLDGLWPSVLRLAGALNRHGRLSYEQAVEHAAIPCGR
ncbi:hypothetical protein [Kitasatospora mediocidica]|uniref:hypothetical protein n=1 Tax=Kitasatospora mediocidica TaxID=58352 RepID=UPI000569EB01|nr:hypothetical protein [Kitasatospora mediocidica]